MPPLTPPSTPSKTTTSTAGVGASDDRVTVVHTTTDETTVRRRRRRRGSGQGGHGGERPLSDGSRGSGDLLGLAQDVARHDERLNQHDRQLTQLRDDGLATRRELLEFRDTTGHHLTEQDRCLAQLGEDMSDLKAHYATAEDTQRALVAFMGRVEATEADKHATLNALARQNEQRLALTGQILPPSITGGVTLAVALIGNHLVPARAFAPGLAVALGVLLACALWAWLRVRVWRGGQVV